MDTNPNKTSLEQRISDWKLSFTGSSLTSEDIEELSDHISDSFEEYQNLGLNDDDAWYLALHKLGPAKVLDEEFSKVNPEYAVSRNWMMLLWGASAAIIFQALFVSIPVLVQFFLWPEIEGNRKYLDPKTLNHLFNTSSLILILLFLISFLWGRKISDVFNRILTSQSHLFAIGAILLGLFCAFANFLILNSAFRVYAKDLWLSSNSDSLGRLLFCLYASVILLTAYTTLRYKSEHFRNLTSFSKSINWKSALLLGLLAQIPVQYSFSLKGDYQPILIAAPLFALIGWMISYSKKPSLNLFLAQSLPMLLFLFVTFFETSRSIYIAFYITPLSSLISGFLFGKKFSKDRRLELS